MLEKWIKDNPSIIFVTSVKGNKTVPMSKQEYINNALELLYDK